VDATLLFLSVVTVVELEGGILRIERRDAVQDRRLREWMDHLVPPELAERIVPVDAAVALLFTCPIHAQIAAAALVHGMTVLTRNVADFLLTGAAILNPWEVDVM